MRIVPYFFVFPYSLRNECMRLKGLSKSLAHHFAAFQIFFFPASILKPLVALVRLPLRS